MKELDISIGKWAAQNSKNLSLEECRQFESEVLDLETPDLWEILLKEKVSEELQELQK